MKHFLFIVLAFPLLAFGQIGTVNVPLMLGTNGVPVSHPGFFETNAAAIASAAAPVISLDAGRITSGVLPIARIATGTPNGAKFVRDDGTLAVPAGGGGGSNFIAAVSADFEVLSAALSLTNAIGTGQFLRASTLSPYLLSANAPALIDARIIDSAYNATTWNGDTTNAPSRNAVRDKFELVAGALGVNVRDYGAVGDGTTDDTAAFTAALTNASVFIPTGTYLISSTIYPTNGTLGIGLLSGVGPSSVLKAAPSFTNGYLINTLSNLVIVRDLTIDGNNPTNYAAISTPGVRTGLRLWAAGGAAATRVNAFNWSREAIFVEGINDTTGRPNRATVSFCTVTNSHRGVYMADTNRSEYCTVIANQIWQCYYGLRIDSANVTVMGNNLSDNEYGWHANPSNGRGHSVYVGNTVNHSRIAFFNCTTGASVFGNHFMGSTSVSLLFPTTGVSITANSFESSTINDYGGTNTFANNRVTSAFGQAGTRRSFYRDNWLTTGQKLSEVQAFTSATSVTNDARFGGIWKGTLTNNLTLYAPIQAYDGQEFTWSFLQDAVGTRTVSLSSEFALPTGMSALSIDTNANRWSTFRGFYSTNTSKIHVTQSQAGY